MLRKIKKMPRKRIRRKFLRMMWTTSPCKSCFSLLTDIFSGFNQAPKQPELAIVARLSNHQRAPLWF